MKRFNFGYVGISLALLLSCRPVMGQSDILEITNPDGSPVTAVDGGREVDYQIGSQPAVFLTNGQGLGPLSIAEGPEGGPEPVIVVHIKFYETLDSRIMQGVGTRNAWLLEPPPAPDNTPSDRMQVITAVNPGNPLMRDYTFTLNSDPIPASIVFVPSSSDFRTVESESRFNLTNNLFFATPGNSNETVPPFKVYVTSDAEIPEPSSFMLALIAVGMLRLRTGRR
jgi:hypothetical protein